MRTGKVLMKKTVGPGLCSRVMLMYYTTVIIFMYIIATMYTSIYTHRTQLAKLQQENERMKAEKTANEGVSMIKPKEHQQDIESSLGDQKAQNAPRALPADMPSPVIPPPVAVLVRPPVAPVAPPSVVPAVASEVHPGPSIEKPTEEKKEAVEAVPATKPPAVETPALKKSGTADVERRDAVKAALMHSWEGYKKFAWGTDELMPQARQGHNWLGQGATIIDAMSTLAVMGQVEEFKKAAEWVKNDLHFENKGDVSFFETTIRVLGGILSAYETSCDLYGCDAGLLEKAKDIGTRLAKAFDTPSGLPLATINLQSGRGSTPGWTGGAAILAEVGTVQLEFGTLSRYTKDPSFEEKALKAFRVLERGSKPNHGLMALYVDINSGHFTTNHVSLGAMGDSAFEYLLKVWIQRGKKDDWIKKMYDEASHGILEHLVQTSGAGDVYVAESKGGSLIHKMDHLACFVGGMFVLGSQYSDNPERHMQVAKGIGETCYQMYAKMPSGLAPENSEFGGGQLQAGASYNIQRPEAVETFFYLWRATKDPIWREHGWKVFEAFNRCCKVESGGFVGVRDVKQGNPPLDDTQQTFWLAETLKYLYLLFSDDEAVPLDKFVFNTEAHPLKIWTDDKPVK